MEKFYDLDRKKIETISKRLNDYKLVYDNNLKFKNGLKFGCELEFKNNINTLYFFRRLITRDSKFIHKVDYDIQEYCIMEVSTDKLYDEKKSWDELKRICEILKYNESFTDYACGAHIHFDPSIIEDKNLIYFLKLWYVLENITYRMGIGEFKELRPGAEKYAITLNRELKNLIYLYEKNEIPLSNFSVFDKRYGLNLKNHLGDRSKIDTYEVRVCNGTIDELTWQSNIEYFASMFKFANDENNFEFINELYSRGKLKSTNYNLVFALNFLHSDNEEIFIKQIKQKIL